MYHMHAHNILLVRWIVCVCAITHVHSTIFLLPLYSNRMKNCTIKRTIFCFKGLYGLDEVLQFASDDHFFLHNDQLLELEWKNACMTLEGSCDLQLAYVSHIYVHTFLSPSVRILSYLMIWINYIVQYHTTLHLSSGRLCMFRGENKVCKFAIRCVKGLFGISDVLQFASVQDLVHFSTLHSIEIGVKLRPMNVTDHQKQKKQKKMVHSDSKVSEVHNGRDLVLCINCRTLL